VTTRIDATRLIPGDGDPIDDASLVIDGPSIGWIGPTAEAPDAETVISAETVMPGMWDAHAHFFGLQAANIELLVQMAPQAAILRSLPDMRAILDAGFTSVREVGGHGTYLADAVEAGTVSGPWIYAAGAPLSQTGGHADLHGLPVDVVDDVFERHIGSPTVADGADDCRRLVRRQLRLGARVIKVCASGGVMSQIDHPKHQQFSDEELKAIVEEAARAERVVAAHCHGKPGIMAALRAGVKTIEHGSHLDVEAAKAMADSGAILVPTRFVVQHLVDRGLELGMPDYAFKKINDIAERHFQAMQTAVSYGVKFATGTDIFMPGAAGRNGEELGHLVAAGLSPLQAIEAATATGPLTLGPQAPEAGQLLEGYDADVICVTGDPLDDISVLADSANVTHVFQRGSLVKG
jgi:imidazolonepropionase-like amidohydrolase